MNAEADLRRRLVVFETTRARVRHKTPDDAGDDFEWRRDPALQRFNGELPYEGSYETFLVQFEMDRVFGHERRGMFSIENLDGEHIGNLMYYNADRAEGVFELGITIADERLRNAGLGREVVVGFLRYAWRSMPFRRAILHTLAWNERAQRAFVAAGFEPVGRMHRAGQEFIRMEARRERWLLRDANGDFDPGVPPVGERDASRKP